MRGRDLQPGEELRVLGPIVPTNPPDNFGAAWEIAARVQRRSFDPDDPVKIELFLTGYGRCSSAKLTVYIPDGIFSERKNDSGKEPANYVGTIRSSIGQAVRPGLPTNGGPESQTLEAPIPRIQESRFGYPGVTITLNSGNFLDRFSANETPGQDVRPRRLEVGWTVGERKWDDVAPISIEARISPKPTPGDHTIPLVLTYMTQGKVLSARTFPPMFTGTFERRVRTSTFTLNVHVSFFWEQDWFQWFVIGGTVAGMILGAVAVVLSVYHPV